MRKIFTTIAVTIIAATMAQAQLKVTSTGMVGLGTGSVKPNAALDLGTANFVKGNPIFLMYNDNNTGFFTGTKMGFYINNFCDNNLNLVFPEVAAFPGLFTICGKNTAGISLRQYFSIAGMTGNVGIGSSPNNDKVTINGGSGTGLSVYVNQLVDWGHSIASYVTRANTVSYAVNLNGTDKFWVSGDGNVWANGSYWTSDSSMKKNIIKMQKSTSLSIIKKLNGFNYDFKNDSNILASKTRKSKIYKGQHFGLIAQEVENILPELVGTNRDGSKAINYIELIPFIIESIKEQQVGVDSLKTVIIEQSNIITSYKKQINSLEDEISTLQQTINTCCKSSGSKTKSNVENDNIDILTSQTSTAVLYQNSPNPFKQSTTIKLELPQTIVSALVCIYDLNGRQLKCFTVTGRGNTSVQITASELSAGMYHYALIADGNLIDTKTMVLTE